MKRLSVVGCRLPVQTSASLPQAVGFNRQPDGGFNRQPTTDNRQPLFRRQPLLRIGVDAGGTFTDFVVLHDNGRLESFKLRSNPAAPAAVILEGIQRATGGGRAEVVHGS